MNSTRNGGNPSPLRFLPRALLWMIALLAVGLGGCAQERPEPRPKNVLILMIDTLRADHLGAYGYPRETSPVLDQLAAEGILFEDVTSAAPTTFPSVNSLFTSRTPDLFYRTSSRDLGIPEELTTLAEALRDAGLQTAAISPSPVVRQAPSFFNPDGGFGQGFDRFDETCGYKERHVPSYTTPCVNEKALEILDDLTADGNPFFFYVHYLDPHDPYVPPEENRVFSAGYESELQFVSEGRTYPLTQALFGTGEPVDYSERDIQHMIDLYDDEIRGVDTAIGELLARLEERGVLDDTLVVVVSDHGESFLEHPTAWQHGRSVYQSELHVPLLFRWPGGLPAGERRSEAVCSIDVMPTILELMGLEPVEGMVGSSLLGPDAAGRESNEICFAAGRANWKAQNANLLALRQGRAKIIYDRGQDAYEVYNLSSDAGEKNNLAPESWDQAPQNMLSLRTALDLFGDLTPLGADEAVALDPEAEKALRALGYIQ